MADAPDEALGLRFQVHVEDIGDLGDWQKCEGLAVEYDIFEYKEGGENGYVHRFPGRAKHQNIKLTRPISPTSSTVAAWVGKVRQRARPLNGLDPRARCVRQAGRAVEPHRGVPGPVDRPHPRRHGEPGRHRGPRDRS